MPPPKMTVAASSPYQVTPSTVSAQPCYPTPSYATGAGVYVPHTVEVLPPYGGAFDEGIKVEPSVF